MKLTYHILKVSALHDSLWFVSFITYFCSYEHTSSQITLKLFYCEITRNVLRVTRNDSSNLKGESSRAIWADLLKGTILLEDNCDPVTPRFLGHFSLWLNTVFVLAAQTSKFYFNSAQITTTFKTINWS